MPDHAAVPIYNISIICDNRWVSDGCLTDLFATGDSKLTSRWPMPSESRSPAQTNHVECVTITADQRIVSSTERQSAVHVTGIDRPVRCRSSASLEAELLVLRLQCSALHTQLSDIREHIGETDAISREAAAPPSTEEELQHVIDRYETILEEKNRAYREATAESPRDQQSSNPAARITELADTLRELLR